MNKEEKAKNTLDAFVKSIAGLSNQNFDLVVGAGDSGQIMVWITRAVYEELGLTFPESIIIPMYRHSDAAETIEFDNKYFVNQITHQALDLSKTKNILFVDDEIGSGLVLKGVVDLFEAATDASSVRRYTVVAEDGGFHPNITGVDIEFIPTKKREEGIYNILPNLVPREVSKIIKREIAESVECYTGKTDMTVLLGLPIKEFNNGKPEYTEKYLNQAIQNIPNLERHQDSFGDFLKALIKSAIQK